MGLIKTALRQPISIMVMVASLFFFGILAITGIKIDIFPSLDLPVIYLSQPSGGFTALQMEGFYAKPYVNTLLYTNGLKSIESKNISGESLLKITFYEGTNMAQAIAEVTAYSNRTQVVFPQGSQPPFIVRFDASTLPVGELVLSSKTKSGTQLLDLANVYVRSSFTNIKGLLSPPPQGGNVRTVLINVNPEKLLAHQITTDQVVKAISEYNQSTASGSVRIGDTTFLTPSNTNIKLIKDFETIPLTKGGVAALYLKDVAQVVDGSDVGVNFALVNGKRSIYLPITKTPDASTWEVVQNLKKYIPHILSILPEDVKVSYEFDQSVYVINSVKSLVSEGAIGAILTGLMVLIFLGDFRSAIIVILTIPTSIISGVLFLSLFHQTINIMTLSGLSLAIGILVDESTVTLENIHQHMDMGKRKAKAILDACMEIAFPKLLILLCILAVFAPAFTMKGIPGALFLPLTLSIGFSMITSYLLAQTFVPIMANWLMKENAHAFSTETNPDHKIDRFEKFRNRVTHFISRLLLFKKWIISLYLVLSLGSLAFLVGYIGKDILPTVNNGQFQLRLRAPEGTRYERTELKLLKTLSILDSIVGKENVAVSSALVGTHPSTFSTSPIYTWMGGPQEAVLQVNLKEGFQINLDDLKQTLRDRIKKDMPEMKISFEPIELTSKILSQGSPTPVEVQLISKDRKQNEAYAYKIIDKLKNIPYLRDIQIDQSTNYPGIKVDIDRVRAAQLGVGVTDISRSLIPYTSSSRYTDKNVWLDEKPNLGYNVQVQVPVYEVKSIEDLKQISVLPNNQRPLLGDLSTISHVSTLGEADDVGAIPTLSVTANLFKMDLGRSSADVQKAIDDLGKLPKGLTIQRKGLSNLLTETLSSLQSGLLIAIAVIFLMLAANFQSFKVSFVVLFGVPSVLLGSIILLLLTGSTLNLQSYMGIIMSVGVSISNSVLLIIQAETHRKISGNSENSALDSVRVRMRPIIMTSLAMVVGMIPMAAGIGEGGDQTSPLGRAVIGGLIASTFSTLFILPLVFAWVQEKTSIDSVSLDPEDPTSKFFYPNSFGEDPENLNSSPYIHDV